MGFLILSGMAYLTFQLWIFVAPSKDVLTPKEKTQIREFAAYMEAKEREASEA